MTRLPVATRETSILGAFVDLADSLVDDYDPLDFLYRLLDHSIPLTDAEAGAVLLHYEGRLHLVASSSERSQDIGLLELQNEQGPACDAYQTGEAVRVDRLDGAADRWPEFVAAVETCGWTSAFAAPLHLRDFVVGSFVVFWSADVRPGLRDEDATLLKGFADVATIAVLQQRALADVEATKEQLHVALESRIKIEQAKGMIANATGADMGEAFQLLRRHARSNGRRVTHVASAVIAGELDIDSFS